MSDEFTFQGFEPANTTPVPDVLFDVLLPHLNEAQLKVMLYIIRRTLGFKKTADAISLQQFRWGITTRDGKKLDGGCGLKNFTTISKALKSLEEMGCIQSKKAKTPELDHATTVYSIRFRGTTPNVVPTTPSVVGVLRQTEDGTTPNGGRVLRQTESQETVLQDTELQETVRQEKSVSEPPTELSPKQSTHSPFSAMTIGDYPQSNDMRDVSVPSDNTEKPQPPHPKKNHINEEILTRARTLRSKWIEVYGPYGDAKWDNDALIWIAQQDNGTFENVQKVVERWAKVKPDESVHPEMVKNKWFWLSEKKETSAKDKPTTTAASSISHVSQEISDRNLARLHARIAAKRAAAGKEE